ncbi:unnamed protein product, partial [Allacma fusca]
CPKSYGSNGELNKHVRLCHGPTTLQCSQCPKVFTTLKLKNRHQKTHEPKTLKCDICHKFATNDPSNLTRHKNVSCGQSKVPLFACPDCGEKFGTKVGLHGHQSKCIVNIRESWSGFQN